MSSTVRCISRLKCWKIIATLFRTFRSSLSVQADKSWPSINTVPSVGFSRKFRQRTRVLFPAPDIPIIPYISPLLISRLIPLRASTRFSFVSKDFVTFFICMIGSPIFSGPFTFASDSADVRAQRTHVCIRGRRSESCRHSVTDTVCPHKLSSCVSFIIPHFLLFCKYYSAPNRPVKKKGGTGHKVNRNKKGGTFRSVTSNRKGAAAPGLLLFSS